MAQPKRIVLGTAGHIDHGKTSLVRALTGIDTDRLKEEKLRGITIELGFATLDLPGGRRMSIVDVPGHEKFVRTMVAGASGIDTVLFVVAADEGVMPQTREHLEICSLLGVASGVVALTKADMVDEEYLELAREDVASLVKGTFLEGAPIVPVSSVTGQGLDQLRERLCELADAVPQRDAKGLFRLPVDRVFPMKGFGTVVTGTLLSGAVKRDDEVEILPGGVRAKVRGVQVHGEAVEKAYAGNRTALNFSGVSVEEINRGDTVVHPGEIEPTYMADARITVLGTARKPLKERDRLRLHIAAREVPVVVALLSSENIEGGEEGYVQLRSREKFVACPGDRFVLRGYSPARTVGGGVVLDHHPARHKGQKKEVAALLEVLDKGAPGERLKVFLDLRKHVGLTPEDAVSALMVTLEQARNLLQLSVRDGHAFVSDRKAQRHVSSGYIAELSAFALEILADYHRQNPLKKGIGAEELRSKFPAYIDDKLVAFTLERLAGEGKIILDAEKVRRSDFTLTLSLEDEGTQKRIRELVREKGFEAHTLETLVAGTGESAAALKPVVNYLVAEGRLVRTKEGFLFDAALMEGFVEKVKDLLAGKGEMGVSDVKDLTGASRKYAIPLLEYLDTNKITMRRGESRVAGVKGKKS
ncbi:selenocysteine-specific translation elongation factor [bacterium]|nr:MAG: selenocysteine-specific translation elongation factor [bacterium]